MLNVTLSLHNTFFHFSLSNFRCFLQNCRHFCFGLSFRMGLWHGKLQTFLLVSPLEWVYVMGNCRRFCFYLSSTMSYVMSPNVESEVTPEMALDGPNRTILAGVWVLFLQFLWCDSRFRFHLSQKHLQSPIRSLPSQPRPLDLERWIITSGNIKFLFISEHCIMIYWSGLRYLYCTFLPHRVMILMQFALLSILDLMARMHRKPWGVTAGKHMSRLTTEASSTLPHALISFSSGGYTGSLIIHHR